MSNILKTMLIIGYLGCKAGKTLEEVLEDNKKILEEEE